MYKPPARQLRKSENKSWLVRIEPDAWLAASFARAAQLTDMLRFPSDAYPTLPPAEQDSMRQSQIEAHEIIRVLGRHEQHVLIMKSDQVVGWVLQADIQPDSALTGFAPVTSLKQSPEAFFAIWENAPYVWGGITRVGIDCSGLTQRYYRDVLDLGIPKNTFDQRRSGTSKALSAISEHDLIFCTRIGGRGTHHVGIYLGGDVWHAHRERGVIRQTLAAFLKDYQVLEVVSCRRSG
ncbi:cell wall-associated NlpC family hydrolase [Oxalobacteraceae bacterium GrIS 1.18]